MAESVNKKYHGKIGMGFYHLDPRWCTFHDFDEFANKGMQNCFRVNMDSYNTTQYVCFRAAETGEQIWLGGNPYFSKYQTIKEYIEDMDKFIDKLKGDGVWDTVVGFQWDEPLLKRDHTNEDFQTMTKAVFETYGKRIFPVYSLQELVGFKGNPDDPDGIKILKREDTPYVTDAGFDVYGYDFRLPTTERQANRFKILSQELGTEITSTKQLMQFYTKRMIENSIREDVKVWFYPCAYSCSTWSKADYKTDEDYCIAHMQGMKELLLEQKNPGGLFAYTFKSWRHNDALDWHLSPYNPNPWKKFEKVCQEMCAELSQIDEK